MNWYIVLAVVFLLPLIILVGLWILHGGIFCQSVAIVNGIATYNHFNSHCFVSNSFWFLRQLNKTLAVSLSHLVAIKAVNLPHRCWLDLAKHEIQQIYMENGRTSQLWYFLLKRLVSQTRFIFSCFHWFYYPLFHYY